MKFSKKQIKRTARRTKTSLIGEGYKLAGSQNRHKSHSAGKTKDRRS